MRRLQLQYQFDAVVYIWNPSNDIVSAERTLTRAEHDAIAERDYKEWQDMYAKLISDITNNPEYAHALEKIQEVC